MCSEHHCHEHDHAGEHSHTHSHEHTEDGRLAVLLKYMLEHNQSHTQEFESIALKLDEKGYHQQADQVRKCIDYYEKGNDQLSQVLDFIKEES